MTRTTHEKPRRSVVACRTLTLGTTIATAALGTGIMAAPAYPGMGYLDQISFAFPHSGDASVTLVAGGESEGGEGALDMRPSLIYGAAARIELAAIGVR